jgi:cytoplasmic iron level regulating protein YaaA (DUF328/UPF0246 family)
MKILLAPSETKIDGGDESFDLNLLLFKKLKSQREELIQHYNDIVLNADHKIVEKMFGLKNLSDIQSYQKDITTQPTMKAIERYSGVAFDYLNYSQLNTKAQHYIDANVILFSNLFGPIRASDMIPLYRLKQGATIGEIKTDKLYHKYSHHLVEAYLGDEDILDIRAVYYEKFYKPQRAYTTLKFLKDGKVVSHWAKAYRGIVLREIAKSSVNTLEEFIKLEIDGLTIKEILKKGVHTEIVYEIISI